jgi:GYF domain 2
MVDRSWFVAFGGKQEGPYSEAVFRDLIGKGSVTPDTLIWSEGMSDWQKAGDIPGLFSSGARPPAFPGSAIPQTRGDLVASGPLSAELGIWGLLGRSVLLLIGDLLVIPAPWVATGFYQWFIPHIRVPQRPDLAFTGKVGDIWYVFVLLGLSAWVGSFVSFPGLQLILIIVQSALSWMILRWIIANISSEGRQVPIRFAGSVWPYIGWHLLLVLSAVTIIGWAWVVTALTRWVCRNIAGTRRDILFNASGWQVLWRTVACGLCVMLIIPIPWILRWYTQWYVSQIAVAQRAL